MNMVWERELRSTLLEEQYEELGLTVEKEQLMHRYAYFISYQSNVSKRIRRI